MEEKDRKDATEDREVQRNSQQTHKEDKIVQLIVFLLGEEEFGADINQVREIIRVGSITSLPDSPYFIKGVANVRGEIAVIIDLKARFSLEKERESEEKHIIMAEHENNLFGLVVDEVVEVLRIPETEIKGAPELITRIDSNYIKDVLTFQGRLIVMLDLMKVLSREDLVQLSEISMKQQGSMKRIGANREKKEREISKEPVD